MMNLRFYFVFVCVLCFGSVKISAQSAYENKNDSIAEHKVRAIPEVKFRIETDEYMNEHVRGKYDLRIGLSLLQKPNADINYYWIQVTDSRKPVYNFYVYPAKWEVKYYDTASHSTWTLKEWRAKMKK